MNKVQIGNGFYFLYLSIAILYFVILILVLRKKSHKTVHTVLWVILILNLVLHFLKQAFPPYVSDFPISLRSSTLQNICAVSTVFFPLLFLFKKQNVLHDYMYFIGICGGLGGILLPTEAINQPAFAFDTLRFYFTHTTLLVVPLSAAVLGVYRPRFSKFWTIPFLFLVGETIICLNEFFLIGVGLVDAEYSDLLNAGFRNSSFVFGVRPDFAWSAQVFDPLVPWFFKTDAFHINGGTPFYFPVLWLIGPAVVFLTPLDMILSSPFAILDLIRRKKKT